MTPRLAARWRRRRLILNNDGNDLAPPEGAPPTTPEQFLEARTAGLADAPVDSIFYCSGVFNAHSHRRPSAALPEPAPGDAEAMGPGWWGLRSWARDLHALGTDPLDLVVRWCRQHGREVFWSMRMNDQHDSTRPGLLSPWKREHGDWLMNLREGYPPYSWSMVNYELPQVREQALSIVAEVLAGYDVDGVELDFFRHLCLFRTQMLGEIVGDDLRDAMSGWVRRLRALADEAERARGHPVLIACRVPDDLGYCHAMGIDLARWLEEGLVDLLVSGDYFKLHPWADWAALGKRFNVPVYACFESRRMLPGTGPLAATDAEAWRGEALRAWEAGVNGIYCFNRFEPHDPILRELHDPDLLRRLPRVDQESFTGRDKGYTDPGYWLKDGRRFLSQPGIVTTPR